MSAAIADTAVSKIDYRTGTVEIPPLDVVVRRPDRHAGDER